MNLATLFSWETLRTIVDIGIVAYIIYFLMNAVQDSRAVSVVKGILIIIGTQFLSNYLGLTTLSWVIDQVITWGVIAVIIIFQPEIRRSLEQIGQNTLFNKNREQAIAEEKTIDELSKATSYLARRSIGALIVLEKRISLRQYVRTGVAMSSDLTNQLLINIFIPNTPLHDGAVIIQNNRISAASCVLPLSQSEAIPQELGTRHRAAIGLSEVSDAITIVISEETGHISMAMGNKLYRNVTQDQFKDILRTELEVEKQKESSLTWIQRVQNNVRNLFSKRGDK